jgi:hypothetical protein
MTAVASRAFEELTGDDEAFWEAEEQRASAAEPGAR